MRLPEMVMRRQTFTAPWVKPVYAPGLLVAMTVRRLYGEIGGAIKERVVKKGIRQIRKDCSNQ